MDELTLDDKKYLSSKRAAQITGYAKDYVGQLCREGRIEARLVGRNWYVLESSILEHRFGAEETVQNEPVKPESVPQTPVSTWEAPTYKPEPVQIVPEIAPKPAPLAAQTPVEAPVEHERALKDMQSAWQEWFNSQKQEEAMLPDASEMLLEPAQEELEPQSVSPAEELIHIERISTPTATPHMPVYEEPVVIRRAPMTPPPYQAPVAVVRPRKATQKGRRAGTSPLLRAFFVAVAGLAIAVTVIGSGLADSYFEHGASTSITDALGGINKLNK